MKCYLVIFQVEDNGVIFYHYATFYSDNIPELTEKICEYQEEMEETLDCIVIHKTIKEVK